MKRVAVPLLAGALLAATLTTPAHAATATSANVTIAWADDSFSVVRVTWDDDGAQPNRVVQYQDGKPVTNGVTLVAADQPNQLDLPASLVDVRRVTQIGVSAGGDEAAPVTMSPSFDTDLPAPAELVSSAISGTSTLTASWKAGTPKPDTTPGDPLDRPATAVFQAEADGVEVSPKGPGTAVTVTGRTSTFRLSVSTFNEWGTTTTALVEAGTSSPSLSAPGISTYGYLFNLFGTFAGNGARPVILQARNTPTSPWYVVGTRTFSGGQYLFSLQNSAPRQYRVQVPNTAGGQFVWFGGYSPVVTSKVQLNVNLGIPYPTIKRGGYGTMTLTVYPLAALTAVLQRWNGTTWTTVGPVKADAGTAYGYVRHPVPGKYSYRYYVPATVYRGATYLAAYSQTAVLTVT
ncbi:hypothetical protein [Kribbella lupini]|uniref:Fibronectin type-III domain-containing protein n=1 Tax=Kribbella lupini TaxID=291602 RepID=A0ABP4N6E0_9ACTN